MPIGPRIEAEINDIQIQPVKGGGPLKLDTARITKAGLETTDGKIKDHGFVVVNGTLGDEGYHNFFTQRKQVNPASNLYVEGTPQLALITPERRKDGNLVLKFGQGEPVDAPEVGDDYDPKRVIPVQVWEYRGQAVEVPSLSEWLSDNLHKDVKVAATVGPWNRRARQNFLKNGNPLRAQDAYPIHPVSLDDAKAIFDALGVPVDPNRFRYQLLLLGIPFRAMHNYATAEVNGLVIDQAKPSGRCEVTGIDQKKGEFSSIKPLSGINKLGAGRWIRPDTGKAEHVVGENWLPRGETTIRIRDKVVFTELRSVPLKFEEPKPPSRRNA